MFTKKTGALIGLLLVMFLGSDAFAQSQIRQHPAYGKRNIITPKNTLEIVAGPLGNFGGVPAPFPIFGGGGAAGISFTPGTELAPGIETDSIIGLRVGGAYGVHNDLSIGATVLPLLISPEFEYTNPDVYGRYRFLTGNFEAAGELRFVLPVQENTDFTLQAGIPVRNRSDALRFDAALYLTTDFDFFNLNIPIAAMFSVSPDIFLGVTTGFNTFQEFEVFQIPVGVGGGYTVQGADGPVADITATFALPGLFIDDNDDNDAFTVDGWTINVGGTIYLYL